MGAKTLACLISTVLVILLFGFAGIVKVTPVVSPNTHSEMRGKFNYFVRVPPFDLIHLNPGLYMFTVGLTEVACVTIIILSFLLPFLSRPAVLATWILLVMMLGAIYTHFMIGDTVNEMGWGFFGLVIVLTRLYTMGALWQAEVKIKA